MDILDLNCSWDVSCFKSTFYFSNMNENFKVYLFLDSHAGRGSDNFRVEREYITHTISLLKKVPTTASQADVLAFPQLGDHYR